MEPLSQDEVFAFPMSFSQQRFWFLEQLEPGTALYTIPAAVRIEGVLNVEALAGALNDVVERHESLRTTFESLDGEPSQVVHPVLSIPLPVIGWESDAALAVQAEVLCLGFDLSQGPLLRAKLVRVCAEEHILLLAMHHIVSDGWSVQLFVRETGAFYAARSGARSSSLLPLELQYADYACWQREWLSGAVRDEQLRFWREHLTGAPALLQLPADRPRPAMQSMAGARYAATIRPELRAALRELNRRTGTTEFMLFFAAFQVLLARLTNTTDIVVGTPFANRHRREAEPMIGLFVNTLALRGRLDDNPSFATFLSRARDTLLEAQRHQDLPFELLVDELRPERNLSHSPIFQVMFVWESTRAMSLSDAGLSITPLEIPQRTAKFDLTLFLEDASDDLRATWEYSSALFDADTIARFVLYFDTLLGSIAASSDTTVGRLAILPAAERRRLLEDWNDTAAPLPEVLDFASLFAAQVERDGSAVAARDESGELTYKALNEQANQLARDLRDRGLGKGWVVGLYLERSLHLMVAVVAVLKSGAAYVPLDSSYPADRLRFMMEDSGAALILTHGSLAAKLPDGTARLCLDTESAWRSHATMNLSVPLGPDDLAYVLYTSGSTGRPKGAEITHRGLSNYLLWALRYYRIADGSGAPMHSSISFDATITAWLAPLLAGVTVTLVPEGGEVEALGRLLTSEAGYSLVKITPAHLEALSHLLPPDIPVPGAKAFVIGGEALFGKQLAFWRRNAPATRMINEYGPTETVVGCSVYEARADRTYPGPVPIGRPIANTQLYVLDANLEPVPVGTPGELFIGGAGVARGYRNRPELNEQRFVPNPFGPGRLYRTSDLARYLPDGNLVYLGRLDDQVKIRGFRVELGEVEAVLTRHPGVREAVVIVDDAGNHKRLVGYYVAAATAPAVTELRAWLGVELPDYMVPALFVRVPEMPLTANGKIHRRALPAPVPSFPATLSRAASTPAEEILVRIWREVLRVETVGVEDNFFELGGDSIMSIQVVSRARQAGLPLLTKQVFQHQTIAALAAATTQAPPLAIASQTPVTGEAPLSPIQRWFFAQEQPVPAHYTQSVLLRIDPEAAQETIVRALAAVVCHHDALRLRFAGQRQWHSEEEPRFAATPEELDLEHGPLIALRRQAADRLLLAVHHLVIDAVSWRILLEDLATAYQQLSRGEPVRLQAKTSSFQAWAEALLQGKDRFAGELETWRPAQSPPISGLSNRNDTADLVEGHLSAAVTGQLLRVAPAAYQTQVNDLLLSALALALGPETIDLESHGREPLFDGLDLSRTVGWFTAIYPVRLAPPSYDIAALVPWVKQQLRLIPNGGIGYGVLRFLAGRDELATGARLKFNYLGRVEDLIPSNALILGLEGDSSVREHHPGNRRSHLWEVTAVVLDGCLRVAWEYSRSLHSREKVASLHARFLSALEQVAAHCATVAERGGADTEFFPLSPMQQGMLFQSLLAPHSGVYVEQMSARMEGALDIARFQAAWQGVADREEALRTAFRWQGLAAPAQRVAALVPLPWHFEDLRAGSGETAMDAYAEAERRRGFDLSVPPLMRFGLFRTGEATWWFLWTYHHLLIDGWSRHRVVKAVVDAYASGEFAPAAPPYRRYIEWIERQDRAATERFWRGELAGFSEPTALRVDRPRVNASMQPGPVARVTCGLTEAETAELQRLARTHRFTVNTLVQGAWALLLSRYSGRGDVLFGATVAGRPAGLPGAEEIIGLFINTLPVRLHVDEDRLWVEWFGRLQTRQREADEFAHASLIEMQGWSDVPRGTPLFESIVVFENFPAPEIALSAGGLAISQAEFREQTNVPLVLVAAPGASLHLELEFDTARFRRATVEQLGRHLRTLLAALPAASTSAFLVALPVLDAGDTERLLLGCNERRLNHGADSYLCTHELFAARARGNPGAIALVDAAGSLTYGELNRKANQLAHRLIALGYGPETVIGVSMERSAEVVIAILAIWKAGAAYAPFDPSYPAERIAFMVEDSGARLVLTQAKVVSALPAGVATLCIDAEGCFNGPEIDPVTAVTSGNLAYLIYTSGSTGAPKGVMIEHGSCVEHCLTIIAEYGHTSRSCLLLFVPLSFDQSVEDIFPTLLAGARLILPRSGAPPSIPELLGWIEREGVTMLHMPTVYWHEWTGFLDRYPAPPSLSTVKVGGELAPLAAFRAWEQGIRPGVRFVNGYGPTEVTVTSHVYQTAAGQSPSGLDLDTNSVPIGYTLPNTLAYVLDARLRPVPYGVPGELFIGGIRVGRGYHNLPDLTAERFLPNPFGPGRIYRTGDLVRYLGDGSLEFLGRIDQQVKIRGFRIEPGEIETLLNGHPAVSQAAVAAHHSAAGPTLVAYLCARAERVSPSELIRFLGKTLPEYMIPSHFVWLEVMPVNPAGKIDRRALPSPQWEAEGHPAGGAPPRDAWERQLAGIWEEVLRCPVGRDDNFFALGGQSLAAIRLMARMEAAFGCQLPLSLLFERPTVAELAEHLRETGSGESWSPLVVLRAQGNRRPFFCVHGGGGNVLHYYALAKELGADQPFYALQAVGLDGSATPLRTVEEMATLYLENIRRVQPTGPYRLGGHSLGGQIAFEMARQLTRGGEPVECLVVMDTYCPGGKADTGQTAWDDARWMENLVEMVESFLGCQLGIHPDQLSPLTLREQLEMVHARLSAAGAFPPGTGIAALEGLFAVFRANNLLEYAPEGVDCRLPVPITLLRGLDSSPSGVAERLHSDPLWGWGEFSTLPVDLRFVPGDHIGMMTAPQVSALSAEVRDLLAE